MKHALCPSSEGGGGMNDCETLRLFNTFTFTIVQHSSEVLAEATFTQLTGSLFSMFQSNVWLAFIAALALCVLLIW